MQVLVFFLIVAIVIGGSRHGALVRRRPWLLLAFTVLVATSFYSLRVVT